jgi:hypothetical protein
MRKILNKSKLVGLLKSYIKRWYRIKKTYSSFFCVDTKVVKIERHICILCIYFNILDYHEGLSIKVLS